MRWRSFSASMLVICALPLSANGQDGNVPKQRPLTSIDEIAHVYHGVILDKNLEILTIDDANAPALLQNTIERLAERNKRSPQSKTIAIQKEFEAKDPLNRSVSILLKGAVIDDILRTAPAAVKDEYGWKIDVLRARFRIADPRPSDPDFKIYWDFRKRFDDIRLQIDPCLWILCRSIINLTYQDTCESAKVPLPPNWNSGQWVLMGTMPQNRLFLPLGDPVEVYAYRNPNKPGACIALPRWDDNKTRVTLGIICQSQTTGKACFWDNRPHSGSNVTFTPAEINSTKSNVLADWVNGWDANLVGGGKCVQCHRGANAFIIHPNTPLDLPGSYSTVANIRYAPVTSLGWTNPPATALSGGGGCKTCHEIASTTVEKASYCAILRQAANNEMPPGAPANWTTPSPSYAAHINALKATTNCGPFP